MSGVHMISTDAKLCDTCRFHKREVEAKARCLDCEQNLCENCIEYHSQIPATRNHAIGPLTEVVKLPLSSPRLSLICCDLHDTKEVKYYCFDHRDVYCGLCRALNHSNCHDAPICDVCHVMGPTELGHALATLGQLAGSLQGARAERQQQTEGLIRMRTGCIEAVESLRQRISRLLEHIQNNTTAKVGEVDKLIEENRQVTDVFDDALTNVSSLADQIHIAWQNSQRKETIFVAQSKAQKLMGDYTGLLKVKRTDLNFLQLIFNQDAHIMELLSTCESLGDVRIDQNDSVGPVNGQQLSEPVPNTPSDMKNINTGLCADIEQQPNQTGRAVECEDSTPISSYSAIRRVKPRRVESVTSSSESGDTEVSSSETTSSENKSERKPKKPIAAPGPLSYSAAARMPKNTVNNGTNASSAKTTDIPKVTPKKKDFMAIKIEDRKQYSVKDETDKGNCDVTGIAFMSDGRLVICDHYNKTVKVLDQAFNITHTKRLSDHPWDVAAYGGTEFVLTMTKKRTVQFINIGTDSLDFTSRFFTKRDCWGIESSGELVILTVHDNPGNGAVEIRTKFGEVTRQIKTDGADKALFVSPYYVTVDPANRHIYVTDSKKYTATCLTIDGKIVSTKHSDNFGWPKGIVADEEGNMLVSAHFKNHLDVVKQRGLGGCTKYSEIMKPQALAFRWDDLKMVFSINDDHNVTVCSFKRIK